MENLIAQALGQEASQLAASEKQHLLSRLLARLAHEIRNPLSSLDIHVQLLEEDLGAIAPGQREKWGSRLEIIQGELHRLENIVKQFLRLAGPSALDLEQVELRRLIEHVCQLLTPEAASRGIEINFQAEPDLPALIGDSSQLTQALMNLVINALQAVQRQGRVNIRALHRPGEEWVVVEVSDSGPGIPEGKETTIFEPYFTTKSEGSGLGLWIAQQISIAHNGDLRAVNVPGGGALFRLRLPLSRKEPDSG